MFRVETYSGDNQRAINKFYKLHKQNVSASINDRIIIAISDSGEQLVGVALLRDYSEGDHPVWLLRSVFVTPRMRKLGIATELIKEAFESINYPVYTLCEPNLVPLYQSTGFEHIKTCPPQLQNLKTKKDLTLLVRSLSSNDDDLVF